MEDVLMVAIVVAGVVALVWLVLKYGVSGHVTLQKSYLDYPKLDAPTWESTTTYPEKKDEDK